jgi:hypothetical protein
MFVGEGVNNHGADRTGVPLGFAIKIGGDIVDGRGKNGLVCFEIFSRFCIWNE